MPVNVIGTLKPKNNGKFPVAEAVDIKVTEDLRLDEALENKADLVTLNFALAGKADISDINSLQAEIDQIVISSSAEAVVAPEVAAARVGADGVTYSTLKAREDADSKKFLDFKNDIVVSNVNYLLNSLYTEDYCYYNGIEPRELPNANVGIYAAIPIFEGVTYYYRDLYGYFCWYKIGDNDAVRFTSNEATISSGSFTASGNGYVYITIDKRIVSDSRTIFTDSQEMYLSKSYNSYYTTSAGFRDVTVYDTILNAGIKKGCAFGGNSYNGAHIDTSSKSLVIPSGETGKDSYIGAYYDLTNYNITLGKKIPCIFAINKGGYSEKLTLSANYSSASIIAEDNVYKIDNDGTEWHLVYINYTTNAQFKIYVQVLGTTQMYSDTTISIVESYAVSQEYADYIINKVAEMTSDVKEIITLPVGTNKTYTSLRTALEYAAAHYDDNTIYEVQLYDDEYDVADDITAEELTTASEYIGLTVTKNVRLVGMNNYRKCVITLTLNGALDESVLKRISTLNLKDNAELENLTVKAKKCRYAIHDDFSSGTNRKKTIKNCKFYSDDTFYHRAYGAGYRSGDEWTFENCVFEMADTQAYAPFSAHNNVAFTKPANIKFVNCRFSGGQYGSMFGSITNDTDILNTVTFIGCKTPDSVPAVRLYEESAVSLGTGCLVSVTGFGNSFDNTDVLIQVTDGQDYSDQIDLL